MAVQTRYASSTPDCRTELLFDLDPSQAVSASIAIKTSKENFNCQSLLMGTTPLFVIFYPLNCSSRLAECLQRQIYYLFRFELERKK